MKELNGYDSFIKAKSKSLPLCGLAKVPKLSGHLFPFQKEIVAWALRRGRAAIFADTGLGKTRMQLEWARHVAKHTGGKVLVLAPLAVAQQTVREGAAIGVDVKYAKDASEVGEGITITNYDRLAKFDCSVFAGVVLDECGILKSYMGATKRLIVESFARTPFRLACSATPAPNDHLELGNQAEFLGVLTSHEMIARWFINDTSTMGTYRLRGHAVVPFWDWLSSWARCVSKPSDLGLYSDEGYVLPPLVLSREIVDVDVSIDRGDNLFRSADMSATSVHKEKRLTAVARATRIAELVLAEPYEQWIVWCDTDYEADALTESIPEAVEVRGPHSLEQKESRLADFSEGRTRVLITKAKIAGFGLNWQKVARVAFVGASFSYEAFYQAIRRCWRFGQTREVRVYVAMSHTETAIWSVLTRKADAHDEMKIEMLAATRRAAAKEDNKAVDYDANCVVRLPVWLIEGKAS